MRFTTANIENLKTTDREQLVPADGLKGFYIKVLPNGLKSFYFNCAINGKRHRSSLGRFPEVSLEAATLAWKTKLKRATALSDPSIADSSLTIKEAWRLYEVKYAREHLAASTVNQYAGYMYEMDAALGGLPIEAVNEDIMFDYLERFEHNTAKGNRVKSAFSSTFKYLKGKRIIKGANPTTDIPRNKEKPKTRKLSVSELQGFLEALTESQVAETHKAILKLHLLTLARPTEISGMQVSEVDLISGRWVIPAARCKNGKEFLIPLSPKAIEVLTPFVSGQRSGHVFPQAANPSKHVQSYNTRQSMQRLLASKGIETASPHDLRRTSANLINSLGVVNEDIAKLLNHASRSVTADVYVQGGLYDHAELKKSVLDRWAETLGTYGL